VAIGVLATSLPQGLDGRLFIKISGSSAVDGRRACGRDPVHTRTRTPQGDGRPLLYGAQTWGRARLQVNYSDGTQQSIHYTVTKPMAEAVADLGRFLFTRQWYTDANDPFGRAPSVISFDRRPTSRVLQDDRSGSQGPGRGRGRIRGWLLR